MYNTYTYNLSKDTTMNVNLNLIDCFEDVGVEDDINKILDDINSKFIQSLEEKEEPVQEPVQCTDRFSKYKKEPTRLSTYKKRI